MKRLVSCSLKGISGDFSMVFTTLYSLLWLLYLICVCHGLDGGRCVINLTTNLSELTADFGDCVHARMILGPNVGGVRGGYFLHERPAFRNFRSLSLVGDGDIHINCLFAGDSSSSATMEVFGGEFFELRNLNFDNCSGVINIVEVTTVRLFNSTFR